MRFKSYLVYIGVQAIMEHDKYEFIFIPDLPQYIPVLLPVSILPFLFGYTSWLGFYVYNQSNKEHIK